LHCCCWPGSITVSGEVGRAPVPLHTEQTPTKKSRALPEWLSPAKTSPIDTSKTKVKPKKPRVLDEGANREKEEDPLPQDQQQSQSSLFDDLSDLEDDRNKERLTTKRKRPEDEATQENT